AALAVDEQLARVREARAIEAALHLGPHEPPLRPHDLDLEPWQLARELPDGLAVAVGEDRAGGARHALDHPPLDGREAVADASPLPSTSRTWSIGTCTAGIVSLRYST